MSAGEGAGPQKEGLVTGTGPDGGVKEVFAGSTRLELKGFRIPLKRSFRGVAERSGLLVQGPAGWGEFSPFPGYSEGRERLGWQAAVSSATEEWPPPVRRRVPVHVTIPEVSGPEAARMVLEGGSWAAKVKVGDLGEEERVEGVRCALGPGGRLAIDANGAWDLDEALTRIRTLNRYGLDMVEQPVASLDELRRLRQRVDVPVAADELMRGPGDAKLISGAEAADILVLKVQNLGGLQGALQAVEESGLPAIVSSPLETSVGISAGLALAAALPELPYPCGLGTACLLGGDVVANPLLPDKGWLEVRRPQPDESSLRSFECSVRAVFPNALAGGLAGVSLTPDGRGMSH